MKDIYLGSRRPNIFFMFDYILLTCALVLIVTGITFIYSSGVNENGILVTREYIRQIIWSGLGLVLLVFFALFDYRNLKRHIPKVYAIFLIILIGTLFLYIKVKNNEGNLVPLNGARSWLGIGSLRVQPSEFMKIVFIVMLARYLSESQTEKVPIRFLKAGVIFCLPVGMIFVQPDIGTASVYLPIFLLMCFMSGIPNKILVYVCVFVVLTAIFTVLPEWNHFFKKDSVTVIKALTNFRLRMIIFLACIAIMMICVVVLKYFGGQSYFFWIAYVFSIIALALIFSLAASKVMKDYQIKRLIIFINPNIEPRGAGWNIIQSKTAIGSGGLWGRGFLQGTQSHLRFLPVQSSDFIFSILSEEWGFMGGMLVFSMYGILLFRILVIIKRTMNKFGMYIASGIFAMFMFHFIVNVGMAMGKMPITGIPLLFLSYGGSSLWTALSCLGLLMSIENRQRDITADEL